MLMVLVTLLAAVAVIAWWAAVYYAIRVMAATPAGHRMGALFDLGWWRFDRIRSHAGQAVEPHVRNYLRAFVAFFGSVIVIALLSVLLAVTSQNGAQASIENGRSAAMEVADV